MYIKSGVNMCGIKSMVVYPQLNLVTPPCYKKKTIVSGDTCFAMATNYCGTTLANFYSVNAWLQNGAVCNNLQPGQTVCCPTTTCTNGGRQRLITSGDTCYSIATIYCSSTTDALYQANSWLQNGAVCNNLQIGQTVCCPVNTCPGRSRFTVSGDTCIATSIARRTRPPSIKLTCGCRTATRATPCRSDRRVLGVPPVAGAAQLVSPSSSSPHPELKTKRFFRAFVRVHFLFQGGCLDFIAVNRFNFGSKMNVKQVAVPFV